MIITKYKFANNNTKQLRITILHENIKYKII